MRNIVMNKDGTYNFDFGLYHYQNIPKPSFEYLKHWEEKMSKELYRHLYGKYPATLVDKALEVRW